MLIFLTWLPIMKWKAQTKLNCAHFASFYSLPVSIWSQDCPQNEGFGTYTRSDGVSDISMVHFQCKDVKTKQHNGANEVEYQKYEDGSASHNLIPSADLRMYLLWALSCKQVFSGGGRWRWILSNVLGIDNGRVHPRVSVSISFSQLGRCEVGLFGLRQDCPTTSLCWDWKH